ncbi:CBS domain-containing protein, partial [Candidatus Woesearchaeota archaeon]|nr:CBS domain-containing protein [Candidatus Woesearchaeota archaeon]
DAADIMIKKKIRKLPVVENGKLIGIVTASDLITYEEKLIEGISELLVTSKHRRIGG